MNLLRVLKICIYFVLICDYTSFAQIKSSCMDSMYNDIGSVSEFNKIIKLIKARQEYFPGVMVDLDRQANIIDNYYVRNLIISEFWGPDGNIHFAKNIYCMLLKDTQIIYFNLRREHFSDKSPKTSTLKFNCELQDETANLAAEFHKIFGKEVTASAFGNDSIAFQEKPQKSSDFQSGNYFERKNNAVYAKDVETLRNWLKSPVIEIQLFGIAGFYELKKQGLKPAKEVVLLIEQIRKRSGDVLYMDVDIKAVPFQNIVKQYKF